MELWQYLLMCLVLKMSSLSSLCSLQIYLGQTQRSGRVELIMASGGIILSLTSFCSLLEMFFGIFGQVPRKASLAGFDYSMSNAV